MIVHNPSPFDWSVFGFLSEKQVKTLSYVDGFVINENPRILVKKYKSLWCLEVNIPDLIKMGLNLTSNIPTS